MMVRILVLLVLIFGATAIAVSGIRGILQKRVRMRAKTDLVGAPAVAMGVVLLLAATLVCWLAAVIAIGGPE